MPRKGRGQKTPHTEDLPSPQYGRGEELAELQAALPQSADALGPAPQAPQSPLQEPPQVDPFALAQQYVNPTGLGPATPTQRPQVDPRAALRQRMVQPPRRHNAAADTLEMLANFTSDPRLIARARRARGGS